MANARRRISHPDGLSNHVFYSAFTGPSLSVTELWIEPTVSGHEGATKTAVVLGTRGADAQWTAPPRIFETASIPLDHLQYAPDEQHLLGWGEAGIAVWNTTTGQRNFQHVAFHRAPTFGCIDPSGDHLALTLGESMLIVDFVTATTHRVWVTAAEDQFCQDDGIIRSVLDSPRAKEHGSVFEVTR